MFKNTIKETIEYLDEKLGPVFDYAFSKHKEIHHTIFATILAAIFLLLYPIIFIVGIWYSVKFTLFIFFIATGSPESYGIIYVDKKYDYFEHIRINQGQGKESYFIPRLDNQESSLLEGQLYVGEWCHVKYTDEPKFWIYRNTILEVYSCRPSYKDYRTEINEKIEDIFEDSKSENEYHKRVRKLKELYGR